MVAASFFTVLAVLSSFFATPQAAALRIFYPPQNRHVAVARVNVAGRFATVLVRNGMMEGSAARSPILVERFADGWQPLESLNFLCRLTSHVPDASNEAKLLAGMSAPQDDRPCKGEYVDSGTQEQIETLRTLAPGPLVPYVAVGGDYAMTTWYGAGGGELLYHYSSGAWHHIAGNGGALGVAELKKYGVPTVDYCALHIYNAPCPADAHR